MVAKSPLYILGAGGHAAAVFDAALGAGWRVRGFVDPNKSGELWGLPIFATLNEIDLAGTSVALGIGSNISRESAYNEVRSNYPSVKFPPIIHPSAWVSPRASIQEGVVVLSQASVGPGAKMSTGSLLNTGASLDHHSVAHAFSSIGPGARTGGHTSIGVRTTIGLGAGILPGVSVGSDAVVGALSLVNRDLRDGSVAYGVPARQAKGSPPSS